MKDTDYGRHDREGSEAGKREIVLSGKSMRQLALNVTHVQPKCTKGMFTHEPVMQVHEYQFAC